ncbi:MAG TPA: long-chain fatty acid--CoA ligase [Actinomycetes bacterium]|nr:long-chain fatty acid--CoA ligase [Actinomycetes bacterium]
MEAPVAFLDQRPASMARMILDRVAATPGREAFRSPTGDQWQSLSWDQVGDRVRAIAAGLLAHGIRPEDRVAIAASTRLEWVLADFGILCAGAATTTIYPATPAADVAFILRDSGTRLVFAEDDEQIAKLRAHRGELPELVKVVTFDGTPDGDLVIGLPELERRGRDHLVAHPTAVDEAVAAVGPESLATLIYTSGTTGRPKGVRLVHDNWTYEGKAIEALGLLTPDDVQYLWLPLSHSFGKVLLSAQLAVGFATAVDGRIPKLVDNLAVVRPTFMAGAPRIFEKVQHRVTALAGSGVKRRIFDWAFAVGHRAAALRRAGGEPTGLLKVQHAIADRLVFARLRERFGGRVRFFVSGSAALSSEVAEFFHAADVLILEGYGLTETSAASFVNLPDHFRFGTVGHPLPGTQVRIGDQGEVLVRGPGIMRGYHNLPEETAAALTDDGWLHTGDVGELDDDGFLRITDRMKDLIKTSGGKYVAPQSIEIIFKAVCAYASEIVVYGEGRPYCTALVALDAEAVAGWARDNGLGHLSFADLAAHQQVRALIAGSVEEVNGRLPRWETIKRFAILGRELTVEEGDLTPSLKLKRRIVTAKHRDLLESLYADTPVATPATATGQG